MSVPMPSPTAAADADPTELERLSSQGSSIGVGSLEHARDGFAAADDRQRSTTLEQASLNQRTLLKLDFILLPFLSLLFLLNALDKSNIGSAETGHFTRDAGIPSSALNLSVACFYAVYVSLQPVGAAFGRKFGMARFVPVCMTLWGLCTALHVVVHSEWQLIVLRMLLGLLEAGFFTTTVSYMSLFYTRYEFAKRLGLFYGQAAVAGVLGGLLSWAVYSEFPDLPQDELVNHTWRSWQILFLIEGCATVFIALLGFIWLPHSAGTAWFFTKEEKMCAEQRMWSDHALQTARHHHAKAAPTCQTGPDNEQDLGLKPHDSREEDEEEADRLLLSFAPPSARRRANSNLSVISATDKGLSRADVVSALLDWKIWYLLVINILSAIPVFAVQVFLPLVTRGLGENIAPATANLLTVPPNIAGALVLWTFTAWSDRRRERLVPILYGLVILLVGLTVTVMVPTTAYVPRYIGLCVLLAGCFITPPLAITWISNNTPEPGKRAIMLGINGWGTLAGAISALLFAPRFAANGYVTPFYITLAGVVVAFVGYVGFRALLVAENRRRDDVTRDWTDEEHEREQAWGDVPVREERGLVKRLLPRGRLRDFLDVDRPRRGEEKYTFRYAL